MALRRAGWVVMMALVLAVVPREVSAGDSPGASAGGTAAVGSGPRLPRHRGFAPRVVYVVGPDGRLYPYAAPVVMLAPGVVAPYPPTMVGPMPPASPPSATPTASMTPPAATPAPVLSLPDLTPAIDRVKLHKAETDRSKRLTTYGDNSFRVRNLGRARQRYQQAAAADPAAAAPRIGLAQVALAEGDFHEAAQRFREALAAEKNYLANAPDVEGLWGEAADFDKALARLETHLQAHPQDRDAWLALGAQWFLSGRVPQSADVFLRLSDRRGDPALTAFLKATEK